MSPAVAARQLAFFPILVDNLVLVCDACTGSGAEPGTKPEAKTGTGSGKREEAPPLGHRQHRRVAIRAQFDQLTMKLCLVQRFADGVQFA